MNEQSSFTGQGLLPFVGREEELERIVRFWGETPSAWGLRGILLLGEAGLGKSRLLDAVETRIESEGGGLLRLKSLPDSPQSVASLIAESIRYAGWTRRLLGSAVEPTTGSIIPALRRLSRLRPILLIVEDLHFLGKEGESELLHLLNGLAEETLSLVIASRTPPGAPFERFLVDEIELAGLDTAGVSELMGRLLGLRDGADWIDRLTDATGGNPLALRGALRRLLPRVGMGGTPGGAPIDWKALVRIAEEQTTSFADGMLAHLDPMERAVAERVAGLGEIFSMESARALLPQNPEIVESLLDRGVLARYDRPTPSLPGGTSDHPPLIFSHSLVHQTLCETRVTPIDLLLQVLGHGLPLFSLLPLQILGESTESVESIDLPIDLLLRSIRRTNDIARYLNGTTTWERSEGVWELAWRLFEGIEKSRGTSDASRDMLEAELRETRLWLMNGRLGRLTQMEDTTDYRRHLDRLFALTEKPDRPEVLPHRINALRHRHLLLVDSWPESLEPWEEVDRLVADYPWLLASREHVRFLSFIARTIAGHGDTDQCRRLRARLRDILASPDASQEIRREVHTHVALPLLHAYTTSEELQENLRLAEEGFGEFLYGNAGVTVGLASFESAHAGLLFISGDMTAARPRALRAEKLCVDLGHVAGAFQNRLTGIAADGALGRENGEIVREAERIGGEYTIAQDPRFRRMIGMYLAEIALLSSDWAWTEEIFTAFAPEVPHHYIEADVILATVNETLDDLLPVIPEDNETRRRVRTLIEVVLGRREVSEEIEETIREWLGAPILRTADHLRLRTTILLLRHSGVEGVNGNAYREEIRDALRRSLDWLRERSLYRYMKAIEETFGDYLTKRDREGIRAEVRTMAERRESELKRRSRGSGASEGLHISMVGTITVTGPGGEEGQIRGERIRTFLGLLVGAEMLERPLSRDEFHRIATGEFNDPNLARRNTNMAAIRLREAVGLDIVRVGEERHELDRDLVEVDLLRAHSLIDDAREALRDRSLLRAAPAILEALTLTRGEVPFPGLYDDFFESLREDFEARLRTTTLDVADALLHEQDYVRAEEILRHAWTAMPEDEELAERLENALIGLDRRAEAVRVRMGVERVL